MKKNLRIIGSSLALLVVLPWALLAATTATVKEASSPDAGKTAPAVQAGTTLENLIGTFKAESNAQANYLAFAKKADEEGYHKVAKLFRATAMAQGIHATGHAAAIKSMNGNAQVTLAKPIVGNTKENLEAALKDETYAVEALYPAYLEKAAAEKNIKAQHIFGGLKVVEAVHAKLYTAALANLEAWKIAGDFYVCKVCGNVTEKLDFEYCPICKAPISEFVKIQ